MREPLTGVRSRTVVLSSSNIDTDQIIPARFLTTTTREGLGRNLFADWRYDEHGAPRPDFVLNRMEAQGCRILVAGRNFGCGSSREHAPWALLDYGIQAVISSEIADIFRNNALKNGLLPVVLPQEDCRWLLEHPGSEVEIDLGRCEVRMPQGRSAGFALEPFARYCLLNGVDELGFLLRSRERIEAWERAH